MSLRDRLLAAVRIEQVRTQQRIVDEVVRLGGVPGVPLVMVDGKLTERAGGRLRP
jgi:hypothetical protein